jgi:benzoate/toluate 1,2-dioxygenase alpha subunit
MSAAFFRVLRPISVNETRIEHVAIGPDGPPELDAVNRERLRIHEHFQGPFGFGTPDDAEGWDRVQRGAAAAPAMPIMVNRGLAREKPSPEGWPTSHVTDETGMRAAYTQWKAMMSDG